MNRIKVAALLEEVILQMQDVRALLGDAIGVVAGYAEHDPEADELTDRFEAYAKRGGEFDETISKLVAALNE